MERVLRGGNIGDETYFFKEDDVFISSEYVKSDLFLKKNGFTMIRNGETILFISVSYASMKNCILHFQE